MTQRPRRLRFRSTLFGPERPTVDNWPKRSSSFGLGLASGLVTTNAAVSPYPAPIDEIPGHWPTSQY
jgi:hypothetical protein